MNIINAWAHLMALNQSNSNTIEISNSWTYNVTVTYLLKLFTLVHIFAPHYLVTFSGERGRICLLVISFPNLKRIYIEKSNYVHKTYKWWTSTTLDLLLYYQNVSNWDRILNNDTQKIGFSTLFITCLKLSQVLI